MGISPESGAEHGPEYVDLRPGDSAILITGNDMVYEIAGVQTGESIPGSVIRRFAPPDHEGGFNEMILDKAIFFTPELSHEGFPIRRIHRGRTLQIIGIDRATDERVEIKTTPVESITLYQQLPLST